MKEQLEAIRAGALAAIGAAGNTGELEALRVQYLGKKGELTAVLKQMGKLSAEERPVMGQLANAVRADVESAIEQQSAVLAEKALEEEMDAVRTENKALSARFSEIRQIRKETGELIVSKDTWKKARELKARIREVRSSMDSLSIKSLRTQARAAVKEKDFDAALKAMGEAMEQKQDRLDSLKEINAIWKQIDDLLEAEE